MYGTGELILDRKEERYHFDIFISQDLKEKFYIIGSSSSDSIIFEFIWYIIINVYLLNSD